MKLDFDQAWQETLRLLKGNTGLLAVIAGVFFFIPYATLLIAVPQLSAMAPVGTSDADMEAMAAAMMDLYRQYWWAFLGLAILQAVGLLAMLSLMRRQARPTVAEALGEGLRGLLPYIGAQIIQTFALLVVALLVAVIAGATGSVAIGFVLGMIALLAAICVIIKLLLVAPVIAMEGQHNPVAALRRSWALTKGNGVRLFFFCLLLGVALFVVSALVSAVFNLAFALFGAEIAQFGSALVSAAVNSALVLMMATVLAALYNQLTRLRSREPEAADTVI